MTKTNDLLIEIGTEELPPKNLFALINAFQTNVTSELRANQCEFTAIHPFATPRRLALLITGIAEKQPDRQEKRKGPAIKAAFNEQHEPTPACLGFMNATGAALIDLEEENGYLYYTQTLLGKTIQGLIPDVISKAIGRLPIAKRMRWGNESTEFVRPVHWLVLLYGKDIIPATILGLNAGRLTYGHRFHHPEAINLEEAKNYEEALLAAHVIADFKKRQEKIVKLITQEAEKLNAKGVIREALLQEVTGLVEWPVTVKADFEEKFLSIPAESLISAMEHHQKSFALMDKHHQLLPSFITISNILSKDSARVKTGNERVMRARLSDAAFFYDVDKKIPLSHLVESLKTVIFQQQLGSLYDKTLRIQTLSCYLATLISSNTKHAERAAFLAKADLLSQMVGEFPELQGIMGCYYAKHDHEDHEVAAALQEQYLPRFAKDSLPGTMTGAILAIADRIDTIVGIFGLNQAPTGEKDPFGLRRAALGVLRIIIEKNLDIDLSILIAKSVETYGDKLKNAEVKTAAVDFIVDRLKTHYLEQGVAPDVYAAVNAKSITKPKDFDDRIKAVSIFKALPDASALIAAHKRVSRLLQKEGADINAISIQTGLLTEPAEKKLAASLADTQNTLDPLFHNKNYEASLLELAKLRSPVDKFFDEVMVMVEDDAIRDNRLNLLMQLRNMFSEVADISMLQ